MVRLAPGTYSPPVQSWTNLPDYSNIYANLVVENGVILAGSGKGSTTIYISGTGGCVFVHETASLRDLTINPQGSIGWLIYAGDMGNLTICNVAINGNSALNDGYNLYFQPWESGSAQLLIIDSELKCTMCTNVTGVYLDTCGSTGTNTITADIQNTPVSGWSWGVYFENGSEACNGSTTTVNFNCADFSNTYNVVECTDGGCIDHCP
jgi:hypothetical protein